MSAKLKPCPFCGCSYEKDDDDFVWAGDHDKWCPLSAKWPSNVGNVLVIDDDDLIRRWNTREGELVKIRGRDRYYSDLKFEGAECMSNAELAEAINALTPHSWYKYDADAIALERERETLSWHFGEWILWYEDIEE